MPTQSEAALDAPRAPASAIGAIASPADAGALIASDVVPAPGAWSRWSPAAEACAWTVGVEEEVMLLDPHGWALASRADAVMSGLTGELASHTSTETATASCTDRCASSRGASRRSRCTYTSPCPIPKAPCAHARLQPRFGTIEVRIMDAQTTVADSAALTALVQCLVRLEATEGSGVDPLFDLPEVLAENRFLAARDGAEASLIDARLGRRSPVPRVLDSILEQCVAHAQDLGCEQELQWTRNLAATPRPKRQMGLASGPDKLPGLVEALSALF